MDLVLRRAEMIAEHLNMEKVPESPWSPQHPLMKASIERGAQKLSDRPIAFLCDDEIVVVGDCVQKILAGIAMFLNLVASQQEKWNKRRASEPVVQAAITKAERLVGSTVAKDLRVPQQTWNSYLFCLNEVGVNVILTDGQ